MQKVRWIVAVVLIVGLCFGSVSAETTNTSDSSAEEPAAEEPAAEEPAAEEPAAEEPAAEEPAAEEPAAEEPTAEEPAAEEPAVEEPAVEEPAVEEPAVEEPAAEVTLYEKSGMIYDFETMEGIPGVLMSFTRQSDGAYFEIFTDEAGIYFIQLEEGTYLVSLQCEAYTGAEIEMFVGPEPPVRERR